LRRAPFFYFFAILAVCIRLYVFACSACKSLITCSCIGMNAWFLLELSARLLLASAISREFCMSCSSDSVYILCFPVLDCTCEDYKSSSCLSSDALPRNNVSRRLELRSELFFTGARAEPLRSPGEREARTSGQAASPVPHEGDLSYRFWYVWLLNQEV